MRAERFHWTETGARLEELLKLTVAFVEAGDIYYWRKIEAADPTGYGRLLTSADGELLAIREHKGLGGPITLPVRHPSSTIRLPPAPPSSAG